MANQDDSDEIEIQHRALIEEEGIDISELPKEIRSAMRSFNQKLTQYEDTGEAKLFLQLQQDDVAIANNILTFIEDEEADDEEEEEVDLDDEDDEDDEQEVVSKKQTQTKQGKEKQQTQQSQPVSNSSSSTPVSPSTPPEPATPVAPPVAQNNLSDEDKVKAAMKDGVISVEQLERILNREPDYPYEQVGNLKLKKQYLRPFYEMA